MVRPEEIFGVNAGKVWHVLNTNKKELSIAEIMKLGKLKRDEAISGLGWLGREGKIKIEKTKNGLGLLYKLV